MNENDDAALVPMQSRAVEKAQPTGNRILAGMVADSLALANQNESPIRQPRFRIGDYDWCEPDYWQILLWSQQLAIAPEEVVGRLKAAKRRTLVSPKWGETIFEDGRLIKLCWDYALLPIQELTWVRGLRLSHLHYDVPHGQRVSLGAASFPLPSLTHLSCEGLGITYLGISEATGLEELLCRSNSLRGFVAPNFKRLRKLDCSGNCLRILDLAGCPMLTELRCGHNSLSELKLDGVPNLLRLDLSESSWAHGCRNAISRIALESVPKLTHLSCDGMALAFLNLTGLGELQSLSCGWNIITHLVLGQKPKLRYLSCSSNQITELTLSSVPNLEDLSCGYNRLSVLDLSHTPRLIRLSCQDNLLTQLDVSLTPDLETLNCDSNDIALLDVRGLRKLKRFEYDLLKTSALKRPDQLDDDEA